MNQAEAAYCGRRARTLRRIALILTGIDRLHGRNISGIHRLQSILILWRIRRNRALVLPAGRHCQRCHRKNQNC